MISLSCDCRGKDSNSAGWNRVFKSSLVNRDEGELNKEFNVNNCGSFSSKRFLARSFRLDWWFALDERWDDELFIFSDEVSLEFRPRVFRLRLRFVFSELEDLVLSFNSVTVVFLLRLLFTDFLRLSRFEAAALVSLKSRDFSNDDSSLISWAVSWAGLLSCDCCDWINCCCCCWRRRFSLSTR